MILDGTFNWGIPAIDDSNTATASTNVTDMGAAKIVFGAGKGVRLWFRAVVTADANPSIKVDVIGSDAAALNSNNIVIASSGVIATAEDGTALLTTEVVERDFEVRGQVVAKRYYGLLVTLGGTNPDTTAQDAEIVWDVQTNLIGPRAAVPA